MADSAPNQPSQPLAPVISLEDRRVASGDVSANYLEENFPGNQDVADTYMPEGEAPATVIEFPAHATAVGQEALRIANQDELESIVATIKPELLEKMKQFEDQSFASFGTAPMNVARAKAEAERDQK